MCQLEYLELSDRCKEVDWLGEMWEQQADRTFPVKERSHGIAKNYCRYTL